MTSAEKWSLIMQVLTIFGGIGGAFFFVLRIWHNYLMKQIDMKLDKRVWEEAQKHFEDVSNSRDDNLEKRMEILEKHITENLSEIKEEIKSINQHMLTCGARK